MNQQDLQTMAAIERLKTKLNQMDDDTRDDMITVLASCEVALKSWHMMLNALAGKQEAA